MRASRRFSQAISEGDGISLLAAVGDPDGARAAERAGAEGLVAAASATGLSDATELPILWMSDALDEAVAAGADAAVLLVNGLEDDDGRLEALVEAVTGRGLECVVGVADEDELRVALDRLDPEVLLLSAGGVDEHEALEHVLGLLPDVPVGKLAIADLDVQGREEVAQLERAGVDAVVVRSGDLAALLHEPSR